jgi:hypothetical protein
MEIKMAQEIYKSFYGNPREAWYQLSKAEQDSLLQKVTAARDKVGGKALILCNSWSTDAYQFFGVEVFPSLEAAQEHNKLLNELNWFRYLEGFSLLGTEST